MKKIKSYETQDTKQSTKQEIKQETKDNKQDIKKSQELLRAMGGIEDKYIEEASPYTEKPPVQEVRAHIKWRAAAACLAVFTVLAISAVIIITKLTGGTGSTQKQNGGSITDININTDIPRNYKDVNVKLLESAVYWPWEYRTSGEKYTEISFEERDYFIRNTLKFITDTEFIDKPLGKCTARGYDNSDLQSYSEDFQAYSIKGIDEKRMICADMDGEYYVYINTDNLPETLGEFLRECGMSSDIKLENFTLYQSGGEAAEKAAEEEKGEAAGKNSILENTDDFWKILNDNASAPLKDAESWSVDNEETYVVFTASSDAMCIYKRAIYITEGGLLWTNIYDAALLYDIGSEAAHDIIAYARSSQMTATEDLYGHAVIGTVTAVENGYILVDDAVLCKNPEEHIVFKVLTSDIRVSRYIDYNIIKEGDIVYIEYTGKTDTGAGNVIDSAFLISKAMLNGEDILIPE